MAVYNDKYTAMVIFAKARNDVEYISTPNTINPNGSDTPFNPPQPDTPQIPDEVSKSGGLTAQTLKRGVVGLGLYGALKSVANYYKNNYGDIMQDSNAQTEINEAMNIINMGLNIGMGFAVGGIYGGIASIVATGTQVGLQTASYQRMMHRNKVQSQISMTRTQYASINGGR